MTTAVRGIRAEAFRVPLARPVRFATRLVDAREYVVVWVETADSAVGVGHALVSPEARLVPSVGTLTAPERPGHGISLDESALARYRMS